MGLLDKVAKLHENGPFGKGNDKLLHTQLLEQAVDLVRNDPTLSPLDAMQQTGVDLSKVPPGLAEQILNNQPVEVQQQFAQSLGGDAADASNFTSSPTNTSVAGPAPGSTSTASASSVTNPAGFAPPGLNKPGTSVPPPVDPGVRILPPGTQSVVQTVANTPSTLIQRVFNGEGARIEAPHNLATVSTNPNGNLRTDTTQVVAMPRNANGEAHRAERAQQNPVPGNIPQRGDPVQGATNPAQVRADGRAPFAQQAANAQNAQNAQGNPVAQQAAAQQAQANPQGAAQAAGFSAQQAAAQAAPQQAANRQMGEQPGQQQLNPRAADAAVGSQRVQDARPAFAPADPRGFTPQQQLPSQAVLPAQARPEVMAAQVAPQLAGLTVVANTQAAAINQPLGQNVVPAAAAENAVQARDALMAPAGHTLAGFLRRDHRGGQRMQDKLGNWLLALVPGARKRLMDGGADAVSVHWLFWLLTLVAYGALAAAVITMLPDGGRLLNEQGTPTTGAYALAVGGIAAIASWFLAKRLVKPA